MKTLLCVCVRDCGLLPDEWDLTPVLPQLLQSHMMLLGIFQCFPSECGRDWSVGRWIISFLKTTRSSLSTRRSSSDNFIFTQPPLDLQCVFFSWKNMRPHLYSWLFTCFFQERIFGSLIWVWLYQVIQKCTGATEFLLSTKMIQSMFLVIEIKLISLKIDICF